MSHIDRNLMKVGGKKGMNLSQDCFFFLQPEVHLIYANNHKQCLVRG